MSLITDGSHSDMMVARRWRMMLSTCLLLWSLSSLFITHKLIKNKRREEEAAEDVNLVSCDNSGITGANKVARKRQVVKGWFDFHGELLHVGDIESTSSENFSSEETEFDMKIGLGRHDRSFTNMVYDRVSRVLYHEQSVRKGQNSVIMLLKVRE